MRRQVPARCAKLEQPTDCQNNGFERKDAKTKQHDKILTNNADDKANPGKQGLHDRASGRQGRRRRRGRRPNREAGRRTQVDSSAAGRQSGRTERHSERNRHAFQAGQKGRGRSGQGTHGRAERSIQRARRAAARRGGGAKRREPSVAQLSEQGRAARPDRRRQRRRADGRSDARAALRRAPALGAGPQVRHHRFRAGREADAERASPCTRDRDRPCSAR